MYDVGRGAFSQLDLAIRDGTIVEVGPLPPTTTRELVLDTPPGLYLLPGLIDCHVHLCCRSEDADPSANASRSDAQIAAYAARAAERTLLAGITTARDVGGWNYVEMSLRERIEAGSRIGPRLRLAGRLLSMPTPAVAYYPGMYEVASGVDDVRSGARRQLERGADLIKVMATGAMLSPEDENAREVQYSIEELRAAVEAAAELGKHVAAHAHAARGIAGAVAAGARSIEHGTYADEAVLAEMAESGAFLVPTISASPPPTLRPSPFQEDMPAHVRTRLVDTREIHLEAVRRAHASGVRIAMGTDAGTPGNHHGNNADECVYLVEEAGMAPQESIRAATLSAAELLGEDAVLGSLEPRKRADIVGFIGDPLDDIRELTRPTFVMKGGVVFRNDGGAM